MIRQMLRFAALLLALVAVGAHGSAPVAAEEATVEDHVFLRYHELDAFFGARYANAGQTYRAPALVVTYPESAGTPGCYQLDGLVYQCVGAVDTGSARCGTFTSGQWKSFYCADTMTIYLTIEDALYEWQTYGDFAVSFTIAHEWGHHLANLYYDNFWPERYGANPHFFEVQADCLAGVYTAEVSIRGGLEAGDVEEAIGLNWYDLGDNRSEGQTHGSSQERVDAFWYGYLTGGCAAYE